MSAFWDDLRKDMEDPEFAALYAAESEQIARADAVERMTGMMESPLPVSISFMPGSKVSLFDILAPDVRRSLRERGVHGGSFDVDLPDQE